MLKKKIEDKVNIKLEKANLTELAYVLGSKKEIIKTNLLAGVFRGVGFGIGFTIITAIIVYILQRIIKLNIPILGDYISDIVDIVKNKY